MYKYLFDVGFRIKSCSPLSTPNIRELFRISKRHNDSHLGRLPSGDCRVLRETSISSHVQELLPRSDLHFPRYSWNLRSHSTSRWFVYSRAANFWWRSQKSQPCLRQVHSHCWWKSMGWNRRQGIHTALISTCTGNRRERLQIFSVIQRLFTQTMRELFPLTNLESFLFAESEAETLSWVELWTLHLPRKRIKNAKDNA
jgi:hypothetical protein